MTEQLEERTILSVDLEAEAIRQEEIERSRAETEWLKDPIALKKVSEYIGRLTRRA